ncbi:hypothetical protein AV530_007411 [Patagioenas fasciata monilis]|uniref:Uncharacterized protein n=1 Tax=Patagioenas fasciata monilis TaxID=372326 RepID=A0A1V4JXV9_PATFA|nr:hypothetical protein AV530_007411 [Patagioenas fasciata monilis]
MVVASEVGHWNHEAWGTQMTSIHTQQCQLFTFSYNILLGSPELTSPPRTCKQRWEWADDGNLDPGASRATAPTYHTTNAFVNMNQLHWQLWETELQAKLGLGVRRGKGQRTSSCYPPDFLLSDLGSPGRFCCMTSWKHQGFQSSSPEEQYCLLPSAQLIQQSHPGVFISPFGILHWQEKLKPPEIQNVEK